MKILLTAAFTLAMIINSSFAEEVNTECTMMREQNIRTNPKANLSSVKPKPKNIRGSSAQ